MTTFAYNNNKHESTEIALSKILKNYLLNLENAFENRMLKKKTSFVIERAKSLRKNREHLTNL